MKDKWYILFALVLVLLIIPGEILASDPSIDPQQAFDAGYAKGIEFFELDSTYADEEDALDAYPASDIFDAVQWNEMIIAGRLSDFQDGFLDGYEAARKGEIKTDYAEALGESEGKTAALNDFYEGKDSNWDKAMPSDRTISKNYDLDRMSNDYEEQFILKFKAGFITGYEEAYEKALLDTPKLNMEDGLKNGQSAGELEGRIAAEKDYLLDLRMDYERDLPDDRDITEKYKLNLTPNEYEDAFIEGFRNEYQISYNGTYRSKSGSQAVNKTVSQFITAKGGILTAMGVYEGIDDPGIMVTIESGTFYLPTHLTIDTMNTEYYQLGPSLRASELYRVILENPANTIDKTKYVTLSFPYYGDSNKGGIYKFIDERWYYLPSVVSDGMISTKVAPHTLANRDSVYAVFMDDSIRILTDVRDHWAKDEIETMVRRGIILGYPGSTPLDGTFRPSQNITRAEFLILLSRIENWVLPNYVARATYFLDYQTFSTYDRIISYGLNNGYILGYTDRTFRPHNPISYYEVELIMGRVLRDYSFRWNSVATQMMYEKAYKSPSFVDLNRKITRAEVAYMLYTLNEWRY